MFQPKAIAFEQSGDILYTGGNTEYLRKWDLRTFSLLEYKDYKKTIFEIICPPNDIIALYEDNAVEVRDLETKELIWDIDTIPAGISPNGLAFGKSSPDKWTQYYCNSRRFRNVKSAASARY